MAKLFFLLLFILSVPTSLSFAQTVANYSYGKPGTAQYEEFSFWVKDGKRDDIDYSYGKEWKTVNVSYSGKDMLNGAACFKIKFTNNYVLYLVPGSRKILVTDNTGNYKKDFTWYYQGPRNGIGNFCETCAEDEVAAMKLVKSYFMR